MLTALNAQKMQQASKMEESTARQFFEEAWMQVHMYEDSARCSSTADDALTADSCLQ